jgi:tRNA threonylcarbamoyladenosine biosynthesis protein TsaE
MDKRVDDLQVLDDMVADILGEITPRGNRATIVALAGPLGAGKTTFVRHVAEVLDIDAPITSPTYVLIKQYPIPDALFETLVHVDAYRLDSGEELEKLNWREYISDPTNLIFIEWPAHIESALPKNTYTVDIQVLEEKSRRILFDTPDS